MKSNALPHSERIGESRTWFLIEKSLGRLASSSPSVPTSSSCRSKSEVRVTTTGVS